MPGGNQDDLQIFRPALRRRIFPPKNILPLEIEHRMFLDGKILLDKKDVHELLHCPLANVSFLNST